MENVTVFVVDDEEPARRKLLRFLRDEPAVTLAGEAGERTEAVRGIRSGRPDLVFLDIHLKDGDGFDIVRALDPDDLPLIVFVTAYDQYAIQAFEIHAFGYLLKPFDRPRLQKVLGEAVAAISRAREMRDRPRAMAELLRDLSKRKEYPRRLLVEDEDRAVFIPVESVDWVESDRNRMTLHTGGRTHTVRTTMDRLMETLDPELFVRVNRSAIVRIDFIREMQKWFHGEYKVVLRSGVTTMWTRRYLSRSNELLGRL